MEGPPGTFHHRKVSGEEVVPHPVLDPQPSAPWPGANVPRGLSGSPPHRGVKEGGLAMMPQAELERDSAITEGWADSGVWATVP